MKQSPKIRYKVGNMSMLGSSHFILLPMFYSWFRQVETSVQCPPQARNFEVWRRVKPLHAIWEYRSVLNPHPRVPSIFGFCRQHRLLLPGSWMSYTVSEARAQSLLQAKNFEVWPHEKPLHAIWQLLIWWLTELFSDGRNFTNCNSICNLQSWNVGWRRLTELFFG